MKTDKEIAEKIRRLAGELTEYIDLAQIAGMHVTLSVKCMDDPRQTMNIRPPFTITPNIFKREEL